MSERTGPIVGRQLCRAVAQATGLQRIRDVSMSANYQGVVVMNVQFVATEEQVRVIGEVMAGEVVPDLSVSVADPESA